MFTTQVIAYCRVSTQEQQEDRNSLIKQMQRVRAAGAIDVRLAAAKYEIKMLSKRVKDDVNFRKSQNKPHWNALYGY